MSNNLTPTMAMVTTTEGKVGVSSKVTSAELNRLAGVTSNVQTQINTKAQILKVTKTLTTDANGMVPLGLDNNYKVLAVYSTNAIVVPFSHTSGWYAICFNSSMTAVSSHSFTFDIYYYL